MSLEHNLPASGDMCVSVLSRLCTVMPNMYRVGVSKVSPPPHIVPGGLRLRGFRTDPWAQDCPRGSPVELGERNANPTPDLAQTAPAA